MFINNLKFLNPIWISSFQVVELSYMEIILLNKMASQNLRPRNERKKLKCKSLLLD